ncbi:MAG: CDC27 family protein [Sulfurovaceae bacterium]|nr:CDC27 family protein [Sulfurovaceae bacterium]
MINTKELEKRWYKYKTKGMLLVISILTLIALLIYGIYYILYKLDIDIDKKEQPKAVMGIQKIKEKNSSIIPKIIKEKKDNSVLLSPTIPIIDLEEEKLKDSRNKKRAIKYNIAKKHHTRTPHHAKRLIKAKTSVVNVEKKKIKFQQTSNNYMSIMKQKFAQNKNPRDALLVAKAYYNAGNYKKSEEWALRANRLNSNLDESWLIFAKSKDKMGKRREALKILLTYYNKSKSYKVKALIDKMKAKSI